MRALSQADVERIAKDLGVDLSADKQDKAGVVAGPHAPGQGALGHGTRKNLLDRLVAEDPVLKALEKLTLVIDGPRETAMGRGYDVHCPWEHEHTGRAATGALYVPGLGRFKCQHGHCVDRGMAEVRVRLEEMLRDASFGLEGLVHLDVFGVVDPADVPLPLVLRQAAAGQVLAANEPTEDGLALAFAVEHADKLRFDHSRRGWFVWDLGWYADETKRVLGWVRQLVRDFRNTQETALNQLARYNTAIAVERLAQTDQRLAVDGHGWDKDPWLIGVPKREADLRTSELLPAEPTHMITKRTLVAPAVAGTLTPLWSRFLWEITEGDPALIDFLQAWAGYNLTGDTSEERFVFLYGPGGNGKGTFLGTLSAILADYAARAPADMLLQRKHAAHETEIARLAGVRCLVASEAPDNRAFNMERIKDFVGGDGKLIGRFMHKDHFEFHAQFKLTLVGNQLPRFVPIDDGVRRRILIVPLMFVPKVPDTGLKAALVAEYPGILRWMIEGEQLRRAAGGLSALIPATVAQATDRYLADHDPLDDFRTWAQECCEFGGGWKVKSSEALMSHETWCNLNGVFCDVTSRDFKEKFLQAYPHCTTKREMTGVVLGGVRLKGPM